jgi:hypothetical protein
MIASTPIGNGSKKINPQTFKQLDRHLTVKIQKCPKKTLEVLLLPWEKTHQKSGFQTQRLEP